MAPCISGHTALETSPAFLKSGETVVLTTGRQDTPSNLPKLNKHSKSLNSIQATDGANLTSKSMGQKSCI